MKGESKVVTGNIPEQYKLNLTNGNYSLVEAVAPNADVTVLTNVLLVVMVYINSYIKHKTVIIRLNLL